MQFVLAMVFYIPPKLGILKFIARSKWHYRMLWAFLSSFFKMTNIRPRGVVCFITAWPEFEICDLVKVYTYHLSNMDWLEYWIWMIWRTRRLICAFIGRFEQKSSFEVHMFLTFAMLFLCILSCFCAIKFQTKMIYCIKYFNTLQYAFVYQFACFVAE